MNLKDKIKDMFGRPRYCHLKEDTNLPLLGCTVERDGKCTQSTISCMYPCEHMRYEPVPIRVNVNDIKPLGIRGVNKNK